jgi:DNA-binding winged helix-turn-helix (wHTH) protein
MAAAVEIMVDREASSPDRTFEFDYNHNVVLYGRQSVRLSPHESDILHVLLGRRGQITPMGTLIQRVYGFREPDAAATSIRVTIHSLRKKITPIGMGINCVPGVGYEIDASRIPELNQRLTDKIILALNVAQANDEMEIARCLQEALSLAETRRTKGMLGVSCSERPVHAVA